jgi:hypothetical protein
MALCAGFDESALGTMSTEAGLVPSLSRSWVALGAMLTAADLFERCFVRHENRAQVPSPRHGSMVSIKIYCVCKSASLVKTVARHLL